MPEKFVRPSLNDLRGYAAEIAYAGFDAEKFYDYFAESGWVVGKCCKPMRDWRAAVRNWRRNERQWALEKGQAAAAPEKDPAVIEYARIAHEKIAAGGFEISRFWAKVRDAIGPDGLARVQRLARDRKAMP